METEYSVYLGQEQKNGFTGFLSENNFFCIVEIFDGFSPEQGELLMSSLAEIGTAEIESLNQFDSSVSGVLKRLNVPVDTSVAVGYKKKASLYLKTVGTGEIHVQRGRVFEKIIGGNNIAAGVYHKNDMYMFTSSFFTDSLKGTHHVKSFVHKNPHIREYPELVKQHVGMDDDTGAIALFVRIQAQHMQPTLGTNYPLRLQDYIRRYAHISKKNALIGVVGLCVLILIWSVFSGLQKRGGLSLKPQESFDVKIDAAQKTIESAEAKTDSVSEGMNELDDVRQIVAGLKRSASNSQKERLAEIEKRVSEAEATLLKRETKDATEQSDLASEEKDAKGTKLALFENTAFILNPEGSVYIYSLEKKSLTKRKLSKKVTADSLVGGYEKNVYVLDPSVGIIRVDEEGKSKTVIAKEEQWNNISSMQIYNGNIYLLDGGNNALYKYPVTTDGYGDRTSYFKGSYLDMDTHSTFAIDIAVYVANATEVEKYTAGIRDDFSYKAPQDSISITKIITHTDQTELYLWSKKEGLLYIMSREGVYKKQIASKALKSASDVEVYNGAAYTLEGSKIYKVEL
ncbi:MAG: hypothetical protein WAV30_02660 [Microgenomates group bacterium]